jgi:hypothetical protein
MSAGKIQLEDVKRMNVEEGDVVLIRVPKESLTAEYISQVRLEFQRLFDGKVRALILPNDVTVETFRITQPELWEEFVSGGR